MCPHMKRPVGGALCLQVGSWFEILGNVTVQFADDFVDSFLPGGVRVFGEGNGTEELLKSDFGDLQEPVWNLEVVGFIVVHVEGAEELGLSGDGYVFDIINAVYDGLTSELLHLDVVELSEVTEPLDQLRRDAAIELKTGKY